MSTTLPAPATRQAGVLAAIVSLHVGAFIAVTAGVGDRIEISPVLPTDIFVLPPAKVPVVEMRPEPVPAGDYQPEPVQEPWLDLPLRIEREGLDPGRPSPESNVGGTGTALPASDYSGPAIRMRDARLQALVDGCYPSVARRLGQEGRGVVRITVDPAGGVRAFEVDRSTGFAELDPGMGCVARRVQFEPARRDGRSVEATVLMPIFFRLR